MGVGLKLSHLSLPVSVSYIDMDHAGAPFPLPAYTAWVWVGIVWGFLSSIIITFLPLYESKDVIGRVRKQEGLGSKAVAAAQPFLALHVIT